MPKQRRAIRPDSSSDPSPPVQHWHASSSLISRTPSDVLLLFCKAKQINAPARTLHPCPSYIAHRTALLFAAASYSAVSLLLLSILQKHAHSRSILLTAQALARLPCHRRTVAQCRRNDHRARVPPSNATVRRATSVPQFAPDIIASNNARALAIFARADKCAWTVHPPLLALPFSLDPAPSPTALLLDYQLRTTAQHAQPGLS